MNRIFLAIWLALLLQPVFLSAAVMNSLNSFLPSGVRLGMTSQELESVRPDAFCAAFARGAGNQDAGDFKLVEMATGSGSRTAIWYYIKESTLRGVATTKTYTADGVDDLVKVLHAEAAAGKLLRVGDQKILRLNGIKAVELTATHWQEVPAGFEAFVVLSNKELTFILFDPKRLSERDFFADTSQRARVNANAENIIRKLSEQAHPLPPEHLVDLVNIPFPDLQSLPDKPIVHVQTAVYQRPTFWQIAVASAGLLVVLFFLLRHLRR